MAITFEKGIPYIYPGYHHLRLSEESYNYLKDDNIITPLSTLVGKIFCDASKGFSSEPLKLKKIYLLENGEETSISALNSQKTLINLISHSMANRIFKDTDQTNNLNQCANLINNVRFAD